MAAVKKKTAKKVSAPRGPQKVKKYSQHIVAMTYFIFMLSMIFLYMVIVRYSLS